MLVCSSCHEACYCSPEHQVADWVSHKGLCKQRKKELKKEKERKESDAAINYLLLTNPPIAARQTTAQQKPLPMDKENVGIEFHMKLTASNVTDNRSVYCISWFGKELENYFCYCGGKIAGVMRVTEDDEDGVEDGDCSLKVESVYEDADPSEEFW